MMIPESRADQGYAGFGRISSNGLAPSINAMEIMSRFRPIAPKPSTPKPGESAGSAPSDPPSSSTLSFERTSGGKAVSSERSRGKRNRKRNVAEPLLPPARRPKRGQTSSKPRPVPFKGPPAVGGIQKAVEQFAPDKSGWQLVPPIAVDGEYRPLKGGAPNGSHDTEMASTDYVFMGDVPAPEGQAAAWARADRRRFSNGFGAFKMPLGSNERASPRGVSSQDTGATPTNEGPVGEEPTFMGRAAAASTSQPYFGRELNGAHMTKYDRELDSYSKCGPDVSPYRAVSMRPVDFITNGSPSPMYANNQWPVDQTSYARSNGDSEVISDGNNGNSREQDLVTLSLLPDTPSQSNNSSVPIKPSTSKHLPCLELSLQSDTRDWKETKPDSPDGLHSLSLFSRGFDEERANGFGLSDREWSRGTGSSTSGKEVRAGRVLQEPLERRISRGSGSSRDSEDGTGSVMDAAHMEQQYSSNSDPMMLSDDMSGEILWANTAYVKADAERSQRHGKSKEAGAPYLDVLGIPTKLSSFDFLTSPGPRTKASLWGFLKKFMTSESEASRGNSHPEGRADVESKETRTPQKNTAPAPDEGFPDSQHQSRPKLITPQPIRAVGSTLTLERVVAVDYSAAPITDNVERVKEELESKVVPAVITDLLNRVSWVNSAYKKLVGQPECSWLASTMGPNASRDAQQQSRLMGEVMLQCDEQLSRLSAVFTCRVNVRWTNDDVENSVSVPADVSRIDNEKRGAMFVWKLDPWATTPQVQGVRDALGTACKPPNL